MRVPLLICAGIATAALGLPQIASSTGMAPFVNSPAAVEVARSAAPTAPAPAQPLPADEPLGATQPVLVYDEPLADGSGSDGAADGISYASSQPVAGTVAGTVTASGYREGAPIPDVPIDANAPLPQLTDEQQRRADRCVANAATYYDSIVANLTEHRPGETARNERILRMVARHAPEYREAVCAANAVEDRLDADGRMPQVAGDTRSVYVK